MDASSPAAWRATSTPRRRGALAAAVAALEREVATAARHLRRARRAAGPLPHLRQRDARSSRAAGARRPGRRARAASAHDLRCDLPVAPYDRLGGAQGRRATRRRRRGARRRALRRDRRSRCASARRSSTRAAGRRRSRVPLPRRRAARASASGWVEGLARPGAGRAGERARTARSAAATRTILVAELAGARARGDRQHRSRLPADQQVLQPVLQRPRPVDGRTMLHDPDADRSRTGIVSEPPPAPEARDRRGARPSCSDEILRTLGRALAIRQVDAGLLQRLRARDPRAQQSVLQPRGPGHPLRREPAPRRHAAGHRAGVAAHGGRAAAHLRRDARARSSSSRSATAAAPAASSARATRSCGRVANVIPVDVDVPGCPPTPAALLQGILAAVTARGRSRPCRRPAPAGVGPVSPDPSGRDVSRAGRPRPCARAGSSPRALRRRMLGEHRREVLPGVARRRLRDVLGRALGDDAAAAGAALGAEVDDPVGGLDDVEVVLDHDHGVAVVAQPVQHA